jgi:hypothetical protein
MMGRRSRHRPEEVSIDGFLLLDTGEYEFVTALIPLGVFWKMKALDILGHVRSANRARAAKPFPSPEVGSVWLVNGELEPPATGETGSEQVAQERCADGGVDLLPGEDKVLARGPGGEESSEERSGARVFRLLVRAVYSLDRVALESKGPRFIETLHVRDMLPEFAPD